MRDVVQELFHNVTGQTLIFEAPEGRPSAITSVTIFEAFDDDDANTRPATTGTAAIDSTPTTTTSAAAGSDQTDPRLVTLTSAAGVVANRPYLLTSPGGDREWVEPVAIVGSVVTLRTPLINAYASGSTFVTTRMSIAIDPTWIADRNNLSGESAGNNWRTEEPLVPTDALVEPRYRAAWIYVVNGVTYRRATQFDVVRYSSTHSVTPLDVDTRFPGFLDTLPTDYRREQGRGLIDQAFRALKMDMRADGKLARWVRNLDVMSELLVYRTNAIALELAVLRGAATKQAADEAEEIFNQRYNQLIREPHTTTAVAPMGGQRSGTRTNTWRR